MSAAKDDAVREIHGVRCRSAGHSDHDSVIIREREFSVIIDKRISDVELTAWQARYLAAKLYRISRRIRDRSDEAAIARATGDGQ